MILYLAVLTKKASSVGFTAMFFDEGKITPGAYFFGMRQPVFF